MAQNIRWDGTTRAFRLDDGSAAGVVAGNHLGDLELSIDRLREVSLSALWPAILDAQRDLEAVPERYRPAPTERPAAPETTADLAELVDPGRCHKVLDACWLDLYLSPDEYVPHSTICVSFTSAGVMFAGLTVPDPLRSDAEVAAPLLAALASARNFTLEHLTVGPDAFGTDQLEFLLRVGDGDAAFADFEELRELATECLRLPPPDVLALGAPGHLNWDLARRMLLFGQTAYLIGQPESSWLEVKSRGYDCDDPAHQIELAQDVARFANSEEPGLLVLGYRTKRVAGRDVIVKHCPTAIGRSTCERYRAIIDQRVFPPIRGLEVHHVGDEGAATVVVSIPAQHDHDRPFLVHGAIVDGRHEGGFVSIVRRRGEHSIPVSPAAIHAALAAGRQVLRAPVIS
jgi:hypothetical protein